MANAFLEKKLKQIPEEFAGEVIHFLDLLQYKINARQKPDQQKTRKIGGYEGQIWMSPEFDVMSPCSASEGV